MSGKPIDEAVDVDAILARYLPSKYWDRAKSAITALTAAQQQGQAVALDRMAIRLLVAAGFVTEDKANEALRIAHGFDKGALAPPSAPVGVEQIIATDEAGWALAKRAEVAGAERDSDDNGTWWTLRIEQFKALAQQPAAVALSREELDTCRQWFDSVQDTNGGYLTPDDYVLAEKLYRSVGMRVPDSIGRIAAQPGGSGNG